MLADLDTLMSERGIDALLVPMHEAMHASFRWLARGANVTRGYAVKFAGRAPVVITYPMERDEAAASGLEVRLVHEFDHERIFRTAASTSEAYGEFFARALGDLGGGKSLAIFGQAPVHLYLGIAEALRRRGWTIGPTSGEDLIQMARKRKEPWEVEAIASVGSRTEDVVDEVRDVLRDCSIDGDHLVYEGKPLKLGDLKELVSFEIARRGMAEDHETILSQGREAGIPHSRGDANAVVRASVPIVIDIFPLDRNSGYFFDLTRTFCVGPAGTELQQIHGDVLAAFEMAAESMKPGTPASSYQALVCDYFESKGYATTRKNPATLEGYVHSLGHGVGLDIHEKPFFSLMPNNRDLIEEGDIVTIEPGLYYPDREIGVRIEDTFVVTAEGVRSLCRSDRGLEP